MRRTGATARRAMRATAARRRSAARSRPGPTRARRASAIQPSVNSLRFPRSCGSQEQEQRRTVCEAANVATLVSSEEHIVRRVERGARWRCDGGAAALLASIEQAALAGKLAQLLGDELEALAQARGLALEVVRIEVLLG